MSNEDKIVDNIVKLINDLGLADKVANKLQNIDSGGPTQLFQDESSPQQSSMKAHTPHAPHAATNARRQRENTEINNTDNRVVLFGTGGYDNSSDYRKERRITLKNALLERAAFSLQYDYKKMAKVVRQSMINAMPNRSIPTLSTLERFFGPQIYPPSESTIEIMEDFIEKVESIK